MLWGGSLCRVGCCGEEGVYRVGYCGEGGCVGCIGWGVGREGYIGCDVVRREESMMLGVMGEEC